MTRATLTVLVADDQGLHREMITRALESSEYAERLEIVQAVDGPQALERIRAGVDLAFLDIRMPAQTGLEVLAVARGEPTGADLPVIMVSSSSDPRDMDAAARLHVRHYVQKGRYPEFRAQLVEALDDVVRSLDVRPE